LKKDAKHVAGISVNKGVGKITGPSALPPVAPKVALKNNIFAVKPKGALASKTKNVGAGSRRSSRSTSKVEKLVCRYCGSDDLAPSFKKRRDARCRACFKKRYSSAAQGKGTTLNPKAKAAK
jgi:hypothetical protein